MPESFLRRLDLEAHLAGNTSIAVAGATLPYVDLDPLFDCQLGRMLAQAAARGSSRTWGSILKSATLHDVADALRFRREGYTRTRIARTPDAEVLLMCWLPGQRTAVHDHGEVNARVFIVAGCALETEFDAKGDHSTIVRRRSFVAGDEFREHPGGIHRVLCAGQSPLVTLHMNTPPLEVMRRYDVETTRG